MRARFTALPASEPNLEVGGKKCNKDLLVGGGGGGECRRKENKNCLRKKKKTEVVRMRLELMTSALSARRSTD